MEQHRVLVLRLPLRMSAFTAWACEAGQIANDGFHPIPPILKPKMDGRYGAILRIHRSRAYRPWLLGLLVRKPKKLAAVALANKMARVIWAMMISGEVYRHPQEA